MAVPPVGTHCILELRGCPSNLLDDIVFVRETIELASRQGMSTLLELSSQKFEPQGVTAIGLLAESHLSIHTWPEHGYAAVDVFTCGPDANPNQACEFLAQRLGAAEHSLLVLPRGLGNCSTESTVDRMTMQEDQVCPAHN